jgi:hypothetical protein
LILTGILLPLSLRQQQPSGSNLAFLSAHFSLCCVVVGWYRGRWPYVWTSALNW